MDTSGQESEDEDQEEVAVSDGSLPFIRRRHRDRSAYNHTAETDNQQMRPDDSAADSEDELDDYIPELGPPPQETRRLDSIRPSEFVAPQSTYDGFVPPLPESSEKIVIEDFMREIRRQKPDDKSHIEFNLSRFSIYLPKSVAHHGGEMVGLQNLGKTANSQYLFDGILSYGLQSRWVQAIPFKVCSIGGYESDKDGVGDEIWIQSELNNGSNIYYLLKTPSGEYARYHEGFVWLANLAKHFINYSESVIENGVKVSIHNFKTDFSEWLENTHGDSPTYQAWYKQYNRRDFRCHVSANIDFLWKETYSISKPILRHPIWKEVKSMDFIPKQKIRETRTVVTPFVYECFEHLKFGNQLVEVAPSSSIQHRRRSLGQSLQLTAYTAPSISRSTVQKPLRDKRSIAIGDVLGVPMDDKGVSLWKDELSKWKTEDTCWYVLVQGIHVTKSGERSFDIIWLYKPSDTTCAKMKYPHSKELFLSDNCSCEGQRISEEEILCKVSVAWNGLPGDSKSDFFVRQTYLTNNAFVTLKDCHKQCVHLRNELKPPLQELAESYKVGDTVLYIPPYHLKSVHGLEPGEIVEFLQDGMNGSVKIRRLLRRRDLKSTTDVRPNELVYSDETCTVAPNKVERKCYIRFYSRSEVEEGAVPAPYNRDGTGDAFYITASLVGNELKPIQSVLPRTLVQGPDFKSIPPERRLRGLDLYCGGGNFGRGLEEGGAIRNTHAVDIDVNAIHTYWANLEDTKSTKLFHGSVNDILAEALKGNPSQSELIPLPGDIDFISAGSPCPGFSVLNSRKDNVKGLKNQSLVASVAAYIDVYRPKYALLENVVTMAQKGKRRDEDVLSQLICCVVGMGYQVQVFNLDAWSFGSPQSRSRLFVSIAAPGLEPPPHPGLSHSHPHGTRDRGLGMMASGHSFGERLFKPTPFEFVTAQEATADLADIGDGRTFSCIYHADHRMARGISRQLKSQIEIIPINPRGMNFAKTYYSGLMTNAERELFPKKETKKGGARHNVQENSHAWERVHPRKLFPTIATSASPECSRTGRTLHWDQQRLITVLEARRAQGFLDDEMLTGDRSRQWRIVGNSVARTVSLALGLSIGEACRKNSVEEHLDATGVVAQQDYVSGIDSTLNSLSFKSAQKNLDAASPDSGVHSERSYRRSLDNLVLESTTSGNETTSTIGSTDSSDQFATKVVQKRRLNLFIQPQPKKKQRLLSPASKRDLKTLWEPEDEPSAPSTPKESVFAPRSPRKKQPQESINLPNAPLWVLVNKERGIYERHDTLRDSPRNKHKPTKPTATIPTATRSTSSLKTGNSRAKEVVDLTSDDEQDAEEDVVFMSSTEKKRSYVPVDNSMFAAYARTNESMTVRRKRRR